MAEKIILIVLALMNICQFFAYRSLRRDLRNAISIQRISQ